MKRLTLIGKLAVITQEQSGRSFAVFVLTVICDLYFKHYKLHLKTFPLPHPLGDYYFIIYCIQKY